MDGKCAPGATAKASARRGKRGKGQKDAYARRPRHGGMNMNQLMNQMGGMPGMGGGMSDMEKLMQMNEQFRRK